MEHGFLHSMVCPVPGCFVLGWLKKSGLVRETDRFMPVIPAAPWQEGVASIIRIMLITAYMPSSSQASIELLDAHIRAAKGTSRV